MQIVININDDGKVSTATLPASGNVINTDTLSAQGEFDGGSSPANTDDIPSEVVTEIPPSPTESALNGGSA